MNPPEADETQAAPVQSAFEELARLSFAEHSLESLLGAVTELATRVTPGAPISSVTIVRDGEPVTVASSGRLAVDLDLVQYEFGTGPCLEAIATGRPVEVVDTRTEARFGPFGRLAADRGCRSVLSHPLPAHEALSGGLNLYSRSPHATDEPTRRLVARFASYAVVPVSNMFLYRTAVQRAENLAAALDSRAAIDQGKGILMERFRLTADQAFQALARRSMESNVKLRDVAERLVSTGEWPQA